MTVPLIRQFRTRDTQGVTSILISAFETDWESTLVARLREINALCIELVAVIGENKVGHIAFSKVTGIQGISILGLAPVAVAPKHQRTGIGKALITHGLDACRTLGIDGVVLIGHPEYYPRFGFETASGYGMQVDIPVPDPAFMVHWIRPPVGPVNGTVHYHPLFYIGMEGH